MSAPSQPPLLALVDELLAEQGRLQTPAACASHAFDQSRIENPKSKIFADLIPLTDPGPGEQYAFEVDLDSCSGCKACVVACHALNGLEENESWRDVGLVHGGSRTAPYQQTITTACHHCADPGCLNGCPVFAYEKDPVTGIVRHLDDQCIGCQYCVLKCPYDVPKYSERLGIVRKCDMCHHRLTEGEAPACVQACPTQAIKIIKVAIHVRATPRVDTVNFLPGAPDPGYTQPATRYLNKRPLPANLLAADAAVLRPQPAHWPLVFMLTFMPMAVGCYGVAALAASEIHPGKFVTYYITHIGWLAGAAGLGASVFHLGQPRRAWRIFLGWRKSWLSREAMVFGGWFPLATAAWFEPRLLGPAALVGSAGLFCSVMIYVDTHRRLWRFSQTAPRFFGTAAVLGAAATLALAPGWLAVALLATGTLLKLVCDARLLRPLDVADEESIPTPALNTARLLAGPLGRLFRLRLAGVLFTGLLLPVMLLAGQLPTGSGWFILGGSLLGEFTERYLFFRAVDAPKMPGSVRS